MKKIISLLLIISIAFCLCISCSTGKSKTSTETPAAAKTEAPAKQEVSENVADVDLVGKWVDWTRSDGTVLNKGFWFTNDGKLHVLTKEDKTYYYTNEPADNMTYSVSGNKLTLTAENGQLVTNYVSVSGDVLSITNPKNPEENITLKKSNVIPALKKAKGKAVAADVNVIGMWINTSAKSGTFDDEGLWFADNGKIYPLVKYNGTCYYSDDPQSVMSYSVSGSLMTITFADGKTATSNVKVNGNKLTMLDLQKLKGDMTLTRFNGRVERLTKK